MNGKGGMNNKEFEYYNDNSIVPFFPDLEDVPGKYNGGICSTSVGAGVFTFTLACLTLPLCSRRWISTSMVHLRVLFGGT
jgi:hypothetical protein